MSAPEFVPHSDRRGMRKAHSSALRTSLRDDGVSPAYSNRPMLELDDHYADLQREAKDAGRGIDAATNEALGRLGKQEAIASAVLSRPELRSWPYRWPWAVTLLKPIVMLLLLPSMPVYACVNRGPTIARWSLSISLGTVFTCALLFVLARSILLAI